MSIIVGHTAKKRRTPFWPMLFMLTGLVALMVWYLLSAAQQTAAPVVTTTKAKLVATSTTSEPTTSSLPKPVTEPKIRPVSDGKLLEMKICKGMEGLTPREISRSFTLGEKVYLFTSASLVQVPGKIEHVWLDPKGNEAAVVPLTLSRQPAATWSYLTPEQKGTWKVRVLIGGKQAAEESFEVN